VLGNRHPPVDRLVARAQPLIDRFTKAAGQSCHVGVYDRGDVTVVAQAQSPGSWGLSLRLGARVGLADTGSGHVLLAFQTARRCADMLAEHAALEGHARPRVKALETMLREIRARGHWQGDSQQAAGVVDISVPVLGPYGDALAVLTCPYIRRLDRRGGPAIDAVATLLLRAAKDLSVA